MRWYSWQIAGVGLAILLAMTAAHAHHYGLASFDSSKPVRITGVLAKVEWTNPHARLFVDAKGTGGTTERWVAETGSPGTLTRLGLDRSRLVIGDVITLSGFPSRDGPRWMVVRSLTLPGGSVDLLQ